MDRLPLVVLQRLSRLHIELLKDKEYEEYDNLDRLIFDAIVKNGKGFNEKPEELGRYTKSKEKLDIDSYAGLKPLKFKTDAAKINNLRKTTRGKCSIKSAVIGSDLSQGFENFKKLDNQSLYLSVDLLQVLKEYGANPEFNEIGKQKSIITLRRNLLILMLLPLTHKECKFNLKCSGNLVFLESDSDYYDLLEKMKNTSLSKLNSTLALLQYSGFRFEDVITEDNDSKDDLAFYTLMKHTVNSTSVIFTAEIDASLNSNSTSPADYVELKTHATLHSKRQIPTLYIKKLISAWCQMKLIDCKTLIVGFRKPDYKLAAIKKYKTNEITNLINENPLILDKSYSLNCLNLLDWYKIIIEWISCQKDGNYLLEYILNENLFESYLKITPKNEEVIGFPNWLQSKLNKY